MGQQQPPYQMFMPNGIPANNSGANSDASNPFDSAQQAQMQRALREAIQNPNGDTADFSQNEAPPDMLAVGEELGLFPKPIHALYGAIGGAGISAALEKLYANGGDLAIKMAQKIDNFYGIRQASQWLEENVVNEMGKSIDKMTDPAKKAYWRQATTRMAPDKVEEVVVTEILGRLKSTIPEKNYSSLFKTAPVTAKEALDILEKVKLEQFTKTESELIEKGFKNLAGEKGFKEVTEKLLKAKNLKQAEKIINNQGFFRRLGIGRTKIDDKVKEKLLKRLGSAKIEANTYTRIRGAYNGINGFKNHYLPNYAGQHKLREALINAKTGPIGRLIADTGNSIRRIFSGNTFGASAGSALGKVFAPALMGMFILGQSFTESSKAEEGDKTAAFAHDFLGFGVGNFLGWEVGRRFLKKFNVVPTVLKAIGKEKWLEKIFIQIPRIITKLPVIGKWAAGVKWGFTIAGFITEMIAMFGVAHFFQKGGEAIAHTLFGKPEKVKKEELEAQGITQAMGSEAGHPLKRIGRFNAMDMNLDHRQSNPNPMPANIALDPRSMRHEQIPMPQMRNIPDLALSPEEIMINPTAQDVEAYENSFADFIDQQAGFD